MLWAHEAKLNFSDFYKALDAKSYQAYSTIERMIDRGDKIMEDAYQEFLKRDKKAMFIFALPKISNAEEFKMYVGANGGQAMLNGEIRELIYILRQKRKDPSIKIPQILLIHGADLDSDITKKIIDNISIINEGLELLTDSLMIESYDIPQLSHALDVTRALTRVEP
jgi:hypothetical protein